MRTLEKVDLVLEAMGFYVLEGLVQYINRKVENSVFKERLLAEIKELQDVQTRGLAAALRDYLVLAAYGEARHACLHSMALAIPAFAIKKPENAWPIKITSGEAQWSSIDPISLEEVYHAVSLGEHRRESIYVEAPKYGLGGLPYLQVLFSDRWFSGYGGKSWAKIVHTSRQYNTWGDDVFIDTVCNIVHNGGLCLDKPLYMMATGIDDLLHLCAYRERFSIEQWGETCMPYDIYLLFCKAKRTVLPPTGHFVELSWGREEYKSLGTDGYEPVEWGDTPIPILKDRACMCSTCNNSFAGRYGREFKLVRNGAIEEHTVCAECGVSMSLYKMFGDTAHRLATCGKCGAYFEEVKGEERLVLRDHTYSVANMPMALTKACPICAQEHGALKCYECGVILGGGNPPGLSYVNREQDILCISCYKIVKEDERRKNSNRNRSKDTTEKVLVDSIFNAYYVPKEHKPPFKIYMKTGECGSSSAAYTAYVPGPTYDHADPFEEDIIIEDDEDDEDEYFTFYGDGEGACADKPKDTDDPLGTIGWVSLGG